MPYAMDVMRRKDGEYLLLVEENWRGKNLLYRWTPGTRGSSRASWSAGRPSSSCHRP